MTAVDFLWGSPSIQPLRKRSHSSEIEFLDLSQQMLNRSPRVAAFFWLRIEERIRLSTLSSGTLSATAPLVEATERAVRWEVAERVCGSNQRSRSHFLG